jgi:hypothetical protein
VFRFLFLYLHSKLSKQAKQRGKKIAVRREAVFSQADEPPLQHTFGEVVGLQIYGFFCQVVTKQANN